MKKVTSHFIKIFSLVVLVGVFIIGGNVEKAFAVVGVATPLSYQGRLTDANGSPYTNTYCMRFSIWDGAAKVWPAGTPYTKSITVTNGVFDTLIGTGTGGDDDLNTLDFFSNDTLYLNVDVNQTPVTCGGTWDSLTPRQRLASTPYARVTHDLYGGEAQIGDPAGVTSGQKLLKLGVKSVADTVGSSGCTPNGAMWYNSGNTRTMVCNNNLYQAVGSSIVNQFFDVTGPTTAVKTFTFPDASATVLTSANAVTAAQGGTGQSTYTIGDLLYASAPNALSKLIDVTAGSYLRSGGAGAAPVWSTMTLPNTVATGDILYASATNVLSALTKGAANKVLSMDGTGTNITWATAGGTNALLDATAHTDTTAGTVARGDVMTGQTATPKWTRLAKGTADQVLAMDASGVDVIWKTPAGGGGSPGGANTNIQFNNSSAFGGSADFTWNDTTKDLVLGGADTGITLNGITNEPAAPAAGKLHLYSKSVSGRMIPKWKAPSGVDTSFQASFGFNRIAMVAPAGTGTTVPQVWGTTVTSVGTVGHPALASTSFLTATRRFTLTSAATAGSLSSHRQGALMAWRGNAAGLGGFFYTIRFNLTTLAAGNRAFVGLADVVTAPTNVDPTTSTTPGKIGVAINANTGNWNWVNNVTGTAPTITALGASFPVNTTDLYELVIYSPPNGSSITYRVTNLSTGAQTADTAVSTNIPASATFLAPLFWMTNNATAAAIAIASAGWYLESDQ